MTIVVSTRPLRLARAIRPGNFCVEEFVLDVQERFLLFN